MKTSAGAGLIVLAAVAFADWTSIGPDGGAVHCGAVVPTDPPTLCIAATSFGLPLFKTTDAGASWQSAGAALSDTLRVLVPHPTDTNTLYGVADSLFYRSTDIGVTWTQHSLGPNTRGYDIAVNPLNPDVIHVVCCRHDGSAWKPTAGKSTNGGQNWVMTCIDTLTVSEMMYSCAIDPVDTNVVYMAGFVRDGIYVYKSTDCGATWAGYSLPPELDLLVNSLYVTPVDHTVFAGTGRGIRRSTDAGETWTRQSTSSMNYRIVAAPDNPDLMYSAAHSNVIRSTDAGLTWTECGAGVNGTTVRTVLTVPGEPSTVYCGSTAGMFKSTDCGATWTEVSNGLRIATIPVVAFDPGSPGTVLAEAVLHDLFKTTDDGLSWVPQNSPLSCGCLCSICYDPRDPQRIWMLEAWG